MAKFENAVYVLHAFHKKRDWTQAEAAKTLGVSQSRISDLMRGKWGTFSLDMLVTLATRAAALRIEAGGLRHSITVPDELERLYWGA